MVCLALKVMQTVGGGGGERGGYRKSAIRMHPPSDLMEDEVEVSIEYCTISVYNYIHI